MEERCHSQPLKDAGEPPKSTYEPSRMPHLCLVRVPRSHAVPQHTALNRLEAPRPSNLSTNALVQMRWQMCPTPKRPLKKDHPSGEEYVSQPEQWPPTLPKRIHRALLSARSPHGVMWTMQSDAEFSVRVSRHRCAFRAEVKSHAEMWSPYLRRVAVMGLLGQVATALLWAV
jgi:hypothetical protein